MLEVRFALSRMFCGARAERRARGEKMPRPTPVAVHRAEGTLYRDSRRSRSWARAPRFGALGIRGPRACNLTIKGTDFRFFGAFLVTDDGAYATHPKPQVRHQPAYPSLAHPQHVPSPHRRARATAHGACTHGIPDPHIGALCASDAVAPSLHARAYMAQVARARNYTRLASACSSDTKAWTLHTVVAS